MASNPNVEVERWKYIGGSDIPIIMGISQFKKRFDLLLEKAQLKDNDFEGNVYTEYGNVLEPKIRDFINKSKKDKFKEDTLFDEEKSIRCNVDGNNGKQILEIKTTSQIHNEVDDYQVYLVQLLFYLENYGYKKGILAVYKRPEDFNEEFNQDNLQIFEIETKNYKDLIEKINNEVERFKEDLEKVKLNPFITEEELMPTDLVEISNKLYNFEMQLKDMEMIVKKRDELKSKLHQVMNERGLKGWEMPNGTKITNVFDSEDKEVEEEYFNEDKFIQENAELHEQYHNKLAEYKEVRKVIKKGRKGYIKMTFKEAKDE